MKIEKVLWILLLGCGGVTSAYAMGRSPQPQSTTTASSTEKNTQNAPAQNTGDGSQTTSGSTSPETRPGTAPGGTSGVGGTTPTQPSGSQNH